jgi:hypothetical protein
MLLKGTGKLGKPCRDVPWRVWKLGEMGEMGEKLKLKV